MTEGEKRVPISMSYVYERGLSFAVGTLARPGLRSPAAPPDAGLSFLAAGDHVNLDGPDQGPSWLGSDVPTVASFPLLALGCGTVTEGREGPPAAAKDRTDMTETKASLDSRLVELKLRSVITEARKESPDAQVRLGLALVRLALQYAALPLAEWVIEHCDSSLRPPSLCDLRAPSDGSLAQVLVDCMVAAENAGWGGASGSFWKARTSAAAEHFLGRPKATPAEVLAECIAARNDSLEGHGLPGNDNGEALLAVAEVLVDAIPACFPQWDGQRLSLSANDGRRTDVELLRVLDGDLVCYRKSKQTTLGRCRVDAQRQVGLFERKDVSWEARDRLNLDTPGDPMVGFEYLAPASGWTPLVCIPDRVTTTFTGREKELAKLAEWYDDVGARACLVWGDGGMGKTTLVVEFLHRLLAGDVGGSSWRPKLITYYSAKRTRWGTQGLERIGRPEQGLPAAVTDIVRRLEGTRKLGKTWIEKAGQGGNPLAKYFGTYLLDTWSVKPAEHLLVLDNTETLAASEDDVPLLVQQIKDVARYCGRVLLTSRRAEQLGADPIAVERLSTDDGAALLMRRATTSGAKGLLTVKPQQLRQYVEDLEATPLLLEAFAQTMTEHALSADKAIARVKAMKRKDLGDFLYADAWARFSPGVQHFLLLLVRIADVHDETLLRLAAETASVSLVGATAALEESRGIAKVTRIRGEVQVSLRVGFQDFCVNRTVVVGGKKLPEAAAVSKVKARYEEYLRLKDREIVDRLAIAFRKPFAKMARCAYQQGRLEECQEYYELAVGEDPQNALLFDRYAFFLLRQQRFDEALGKANRAVELGHDEAEAWFTRGMILGQLGQATDAMTSLERAGALGKPLHLVKVQVARALLRAPTPLESLARDAVRDARQASPKVRGAEVSAHHFEAHWREIRVLERRVGLAPSPWGAPTSARPR